MKFLLMVLAASLGQILTIILVQGFTNSYFGRNAKEEVSRWFDQLSKHITKNKEKS
jgi:hypothetical protein